MAQDEVIIHFPHGLRGFPDLHQYRLFEPQGGYPLKFLQSVEDPELSFTCMDAIAVKADYEVPLSDEDSQALAIEKPDDALVLLILVVPDDPRQMTANLAGPLVINTQTSTGRQIELDVHQFPLHHPVIMPSKEEVVLDFPVGLLGFSDLHQYHLFEPAEGYPIKFLQSVEDPEINFSCIDVAAIRPDLDIPLSDEEAQALALESSKDALVLALVVIPEDPRKMTANLAGPLVINVKRKQGRQVVLNPEQFPLKYTILAER